MLNKTETIKNNVESTLADIKTINASIPELIKNIPAIVSKHQAISDIQVNYTLIITFRFVIHSTRVIFIQIYFRKP